MTVQNAALENSMRRYRAPDIPMSVIRRYARQIAERFRPEKIVLFGSFAYGTPRVDSDVDLLVVMPSANTVSQAVRIRLALRAPFPMDLLVRTPDNLQRELEQCNWFLREIVEKGKVLEFAVCLNLVEDEESYDVVRYDTAHGPFHVHRYYVKDPSQQREDLPTRSLKAALDEAIDDIEANGERYMRSYRRNILGRK